MMEKSRTARKTVRLGFAGIGWIGRHRLEAAAASGLAEVSLLTDPADQAAAEVAAAHPSASITTSYEDLLDARPDGVVIATPSALHAAQAIAALDRGIPVFCQKPLGRNAAETEAVIEAARRADRLLGVDLSYRHTTGMRKIRDLILDGELGEITAIEAVFHNAYGPDKPWFYSKKAAGGGCLLDLGIHLVDLALWCLGYPHVIDATGWTNVSDRGDEGDRVEDHAAGFIRLEGGTIFQIACSWGSHAGCDAEIGIRFFGTRGGAEFRNVGGSFHDFIAEHFGAGRSRETLAEPPDAWGGRAIVDWVRRLAESPDFDPEIARLNRVAATLDRLYQTHR